jgi:hypothetical protein
MDGATDLRAWWRDRSPQTLDNPSPNKVTVAGAATTRTATEPYASARSDLLFTGGREGYLQASRAKLIRLLG